MAYSPASRAGAVALACGRHDEACGFATESLELARKTYAPKHEARAQCQRGEILAATGRLEESVSILEVSVRLAQDQKIPRAIWMGSFALGSC
jgi:hypothetical protein